MNTAAPEYLKDQQGEEGEAEEHLADLINNSKDGLNNPILVAIVEASPSNSMAGRHVKNNLGWPNDAAKLARNMKRVHERVDVKTWTQLTKPKARPSDLLFKFTEQGRLWSNILPAEVMLMGKNENPLTHLPIFLRELRFYGTKATTFDGDGSNPLEEADTINLETTTFCSNGATNTAEIGEFNAKIIVSVDSSPDLTVQFRKPQTVPAGRIRPVIHSKIVRLNPGSGTGVLFPLFYQDIVMPSFYKIVELSTDRGEQGAERAIIALRLEIGPHYRGFLGYLLYEAYHQSSDDHEVVASVRYIIEQNPEFSMTLDLEHGFQVYSRTKDRTTRTQSSHIHFNRVIMGDRVQAIAAKLFNKDVKQTSEPRWHALFGEEILSQSPESILSCMG